MYKHVLVLGRILLFVYVLAEKPTFGRLHWYSAPSTAALRRPSDDFDSTTEP